MPTGASVWWTDERVNETVTPAYVHSHLRVNEQEILQRSLYFGGDLTNDTYLDRIIHSTKRLFLILVAAGVPDQIFGIIDDCFEDDDLPIAESIVPSLRLSIEPNPTLDKRFYRTQFKYLARILQDGEHIRYAEEEIVPLVGAGLKSAISLTRDGGDAVRLPGSEVMYVTRKIKITATVTEARILSEIADQKKFSHEHALSIFASYLQHDSLHILSTPAGEYSLKTFLMDLPKAFEALPKSDRRQRFINWPHCLANALAWLHANGGHHGAIRPSNVHITQSFDICLGPMDGAGTLCITTKSDDIEAYQYAPPERWKRAATVQTTGHGKTILPSGNRSGRTVPQEMESINDPSTRRSNSTLGSHADAGYTFHPASKSEFSRLRLSTAPAPGRLPAQSADRARRRQLDADSADSYGTTRLRTATAGDLYRTPSALSSNSSEGRKRALSDPRRGLFISAPESRTAVVQTWRSVQHDSFAADVFSLGAVIMDILTVLCKRTFSAFVRHRSKNNRNAGRGGGLADASFHANLAQVASWAQMLSTDAEKKVKTDDSRVLSAVGAVLQVVVQCLEKDAELRPKSNTLERRLKDHISRFAGIEPLHCISSVPQSPRKPEVRQLRSTDHLQTVAARPERFPSRAQQSRTPILEDEISTVELPSPNSSSNDRAGRYHIDPRPFSPPAVSLDSFSSLNLDPDSGSLRSTTMVANSRDHSYYSPRSDRSKDSQRPIRVWRPRRPLYEDVDSYEVDESVDPDMDTRDLATAQRDISQGAYTYANYYSESPSDNEYDHYGYHRPIPLPSQPPPRKRLPPVPSVMRAPSRLDARPVDKRRAPRSRHEQYEQRLDRPYTSERKRPSRSPSH